MRPRSGLAANFQKEVRFDPPEVGSGKIYEFVPGDAFLKVTELFECAGLLIG